MQSRWVIITVVVILMAAAIAYGVWWWMDNEDQVDPSTTPTAIISVISAWHAIR